MTEQEESFVNDYPSEEYASDELSPRWQPSTKRIIVVILVVLALLAIYGIRDVLIPLILSVVIAYVLLPAVTLIQRRTKLSRNNSIIIVYMLITVILVAIPASAIPSIIVQGNNLIANTPGYLLQIGQYLSEPLVMAGYEIPLDQLPLEEVYTILSDNLLSIIQTVGPQGFRFFGNLATGIAWVIIILVISYYMVKDYRVFWGSVVAIAPEEYHADMNRLGRETNGIWNSFLRGQLILGLIIGIATFLLALLLGLPNALFLALLAGVLEFIPNIGPVIASIPAVILALFQSDSSWLGSIVGPVWFAVIVLALYALVQRIENVYLVPRIIGRSLNLHPLVVLIGAVIGASVAGVFGILLAAPLLATAKLLLLYIYRKLLDADPFEHLDDA